MGQVINALIIVLLLVSIVAVLRLLQVMKRLETTLDTTQKDVNKTLEQLNGVAASTQKLMNDELAPTLQVARQTMENVQVTTRALADVTQSAQRVTQKVEGMMETTRLISSSAGIAKGIFGGLRALITGSKPKSQAAPKPATPKETEAQPTPTKSLKSKQ